MKLYFGNHQILNDKTNICTLKIDRLQEQKVIKTTIKIIYEPMTSCANALVEQGTHYTKIHQAAWVQSERPKHIWKEPNKQCLHKNKSYD